jgi:drug/metabolite transporter (DMT)-like permease
MLAAAFLIKEERIRIKETIHHGVLPALICGVANGLTNLLVIYLNPRIPASTLFPVISGGNVTLSFLYSVLVLREKFSPRQTVGFLLGVIAIILLNL